MECVHKQDLHIPLIPELTVDSLGLSVD